MPIAAASQPLPGPSGPLIGLRESVAYIRDPDRFIAERVERFGPVFQTTLFFRKTAVLGAPEGVEAFLQQEGSIRASALPAPFTELHTAYGALNQAGDRHRATRHSYAPLFSSAAFDRYLPRLDAAISGFCDWAAQQSAVPIALEAKRFCLQLFAELFAGETLSEQELSDFNTYNRALLTLSKQLPSFDQGKQALERLRGSMAARLQRFRSGSLSAACFQQFSATRDEHGESWSDERIITATILLIWGAYIEVAALMANALTMLTGRSDLRATILSEAETAGLLHLDPEHSQAVWKLPTAEGVLRETLRLLPPGGGGFRISSKPLLVGGFEVPAGYVVTADPRIGNRMAALFPEPDRFAPERWIRSGQDAASASRCPFAGTATSLPRGGWFPGGIGRHGCPGLPLAELCGRVFLLRWLQRIEAWHPIGAGARAVPYELLPIKIPTDAYTLAITASSAATALPTPSSRAI